MASITLAVNEELKAEMSKFSWVNWSELVRQRLVEREKLAKLLIEKLHSKEEQDLIRWSVELGRRAKKESFEKILLQLSPEERRKLGR